MVIDGAPFSPSVPKKLYRIPPPAVNASLQDVLKYQEHIAARAKYALQPHGSRKANGSRVYRCPAHAGALFCPLVAQSRAGAFPVTQVPKAVALESVCTKAFTTFAASELPLSQRELYGTLCR